jgi:hypothetical protein
MAPDSLGCATQGPGQRLLPLRKGRVAVRLIETKVHPRVEAFSRIELVDGTTDHRHELQDGVGSIRLGRRRVSQEGLAHRCGEAQDRHRMR